MIMSTNRTVATRPAARTAAAQPPKKSAAVNPFLVAANKASESKRTERHPPVNGGDSQSSPSKYIARITEFAAFADRDGAKVYFKVIGRIEHAEDGFTGGVVFPSDQAKIPPGYAKAQKPGDSVTLCFFDPSNDEYKFGMGELLTLAGVMGNDFTQQGQFATILRLCEFSDDAVVQAYRNLVVSGLEATCEAGEVSVDDYDIEPVSREDFDVSVVPYPVAIKAFLTPRGKKSPKRGQLDVTREMTAFDRKAFPEFDFDAYVAGAL